MVVKVYVSGISGNKEVKKRQQRVLMILDSRSIKYDVVDIAEPENEEKKDFMQNNSTALGATVSDTNPRHPLPPQIFNDATYCGDYDQFDMANEIDELEKFLKMAPDDSVSVTSNAELKLGNGNAEPESGAAKNDESKEIDLKVDEAPAENETTGHAENALPPGETNGEAQVNEGIGEAQANEGVGEAQLNEEGGGEAQVNEEGGKTTEQS